MYIRFVNNYSFFRGASRAYARTSYILLILLILIEKKMLYLCGVQGCESDVWCDESDVWCDERWRLVRWTVTFGAIGLYRWRLVRWLQS